MKTNFKRKRGKKGQSSPRLSKQEYPSFTLCYAFLDRLFLREREREKTTTKNACSYATKGIFLSAWSTALLCIPWGFFYPLTISIIVSYMGVYCSYHTDFDRTSIFWMLREPISINFWTQMVGSRSGSFCLICTWPEFIYLFIISGFRVQRKKFVFL